jgi:hypothetical protein
MYEDDLNEDKENLIYVMDNLEKFVNEIRRIVFAGFGATDITDDVLSELMSEIDQEELDKTITYEECLNIAYEYISIKKTRKGKRKIIITEQNFNKLIEDINSRLVSNILVQLVDRGDLETAWDEESNDFIFWVPDNDENKKK